MACVLCHESEDLGEFVYCWIPWDSSAKWGKSWREGSERHLCQKKAHCSTETKIKVPTGTYIFGIKEVS